MSDFVLGIDGGASKTCGAILHRSGRRLAHAKFGGSAIIGRPSPQVVECLSGLVSELLRQAGISRDAIAFGGLGLNGIDLPREYKMQFEEISKSVGIPQARLKIVNDGIVALWGAAAVSEAALIQFGSGITSAVRTDFGEERCFDHLNAGGIFDPRRELLCLVARMIDGRRPPTPLKDRLLKQFKIEREADFAEAVYCGDVGKYERIGTAGLIYQCWLEGDAAAEWLVKQTIEDLAVTADAMVGGLNEKRLYLGGGILRHAPERFWTELTQMVRKRIPGVLLDRPSLAPEYGAGIMAAHAVGISPLEFFPKVAAGIPGAAA